MTELETMERAKMYMEKLANGIDPINGMPVPEEDVINNVRLSRCFFYVADVLRRVIENGGVPSQKKERKRPFFLPVERRGDFAFSVQPMPVSVIVRRINDLSTDAGMTKLPYQVLRDWLIELGLLEEVSADDGTITMRPTQQGEELGIALERRMGQRGTYFVVVYDLHAQHFIMDHLDEIMEREHGNRENQGQPWLPEHDACLRDLYAKGVPVKKMANTLKRNSGAIRARLKRLGLIN